MILCSLHSALHLNTAINEFILVPHFCKFNLFVLSAPRDLRGRQCGPKAETPRRPNPNTANCDAFNAIHDASIKVLVRDSPCINLASLEFIFWQKYFMQKCLFKGRRWRRYASLRRGRWRRRWRRRRETVEEEIEVDGCTRTLIIVWIVCWHKFLFSKSKPFPLLIRHTSGSELVMQNVMQLSMTRWLDHVATCICRSSNDNCDFNLGCTGDNSSFHSTIVSVLCHIPALLGADFCIADRMFSTSNDRSGSARYFRKSLVDWRFCGLGPLSIIVWEIGLPFLGFDDSQSIISHLYAHAGTIILTNFWHLTAIWPTWWILIIFLLGLRLWTFLVQRARSLQAVFVLFWAMFQLKKKRMRKTCYKSSKNLQEILKFKDMQIKKNRNSDVCCVSFLQLSLETGVCWPILKKWNASEILSLK